MDLWTATLIVVALCTLYYYFKKHLSYFEELGIPYVPAWPILGNMGPVLFRRKHFLTLVEDVYNCNKDAKYVGMYDFNRKVIVLRDLELIKEVAIKNFECFPDHFGFIDDSMDPLFGGNLINLTGDRWKEARNLLTPAFTSSKMKMMYELMAECGKNFVKYVEKQPEESLKMVDTKDLFTKLTTDVIATCAFGVSVDTLTDPNNEFYVLGREATSFEGLLLVKIFLARAFPSLVKFLKLSFVNDRVAKFFTDLVRDTVAMRDEKGISRPDMLQLMMDARGKGSQNLKLDINEMTAQAFIFFFGGFDTTSWQMCILAHELAINPDIQKRLQDEIDEVMQRTDGNPSYEDINGMLYMDAVFYESMRLHPQLSILDRLCKKPMELPPALPGCKPLLMKPGMSIFIPANGVHHDPQYYEDPLTFNPDRYYQKKVSINDPLNMGFGIGPRACIGNRFAILEIKMLFFFLLSKFNLVPNSKTCKPLVYETKSFSPKPEGGYWVSIEKRKF